MQASESPFESYKSKQILFFAYLICPSCSSEPNYDELYDYITQGAIIRSRATWYEKGEKNNKYFLNLAKSNKKKSCARKIFTSDETLTITLILKQFYRSWNFFTRIYTKLRMIRNQKGNCPISWMTYQVSQRYLKSCVRYVRGR